MAKPIKKNGKWGADVAGSWQQQGQYGTGDSMSEWQSTGPDVYIPGGFQEFDASTNASLELASSRYGVPDIPESPGGISALYPANLSAMLTNGGSKTKQAADASNAQWDEQAKTNEGLRSSALSMANTYAQSAAMTRAREAEGNANSVKLAATPTVTLKKKGATQATSAKFRI